MKRILILHGTDNNSEGNWIPWLKGQLEKRGLEVWTPDLPESGKPNGKKWTDYIWSEARKRNFVFDEETVLVGHSSGAVETVHLLNNLPKKTKVGGVYLVSVFHDDLGWEQLDELFSGVPVWDYGKIRTGAEKITIIHSDNDPYVDLAEAEYVANQLGVKLYLISGQGHFNIGSRAKYKEFPKLMSLILMQDMKRQKLFLTSEFAKVASLIKKEIGKEANGKIMVIDTAGRAYEKMPWVESDMKELRKWGEVESYDLTGKSEMEVEEKLKTVSVLLVAGGNVFYLLEQMQKCQFREIVKRKLAEGMIYIGSSAGSVATGKKLSRLRIVERKELSPELESDEGLDLVNFVFWPHWNRKDEESRQKYLARYQGHWEDFYSENQSMIVVNDNQLVYVEDEKFEIWEAR